MTKIKKYVTNDTNQIEKEKNQRDITFNSMTANEWARNSRSVWKDMPTPRNYSFYDNGEIIPEEVCDKIISIYTKEGDKVLDPFMGKGNVVVSSIKNNRFCYGIEINEDYFKEAENNVLNSLNLLVNGEHELYYGDCIEQLNWVPEECIQLVLTSPSYPINKDTEISNDYSKMDKERYLNKIKDLMEMLYNKIIPGGYNVWVVNDYRDIKNGHPYVDMHSLIALKAQEVGFLYQDLIIYDHNDNRGLILQGYPSVFYANLNHSYIVVMRKPQ